MQSEIEQRLRKAMEQCAKRGFEGFTLTSSRGDSNCPHPVTYHSKDGHGFEEDVGFFDLTSNGKMAAVDEETVYGDPLEALARVFEYFPEIKERELIK